MVGEIGAGLCVLVGVTHGDTEAASDKLADKLWRLRIFADDAGQMNLGACDLGMPLLIVSQFTLYADVSRGRRPSFVAAAAAVDAEPLIDRLVLQLRRLGATVATGRFGATMAVELVNDGPVTILIET